MRPHTASLSSTILDVVAIDSSLAVLTSTHVELVDEVASTEASAIHAIPSPEKLALLADGRLLAYGITIATSLWLGRRGEPFRSVFEENLVTGVVITSSGFLACASEHLLVYSAGELRVFDDPRSSNRWTARWESRVVLASEEQLSLVAADGAFIVTADVACTRRPVVSGNRLAVIGYHDAVILDADLQPIGRLPKGYDVVAWRNGFLCVDRESVSYWDDSGEQWRFRGARAPQPIPLGERIVVGSRKIAKAWILGADGDVQAEFDLPGTLREACAFGDGIACIATAGDAWWWRPELEEPLVLEHDFTPRVLVSLPWGIATADDNVLYVWREDRDGPEVSVPVNAPPLGVPIVVHGCPVTIGRHGRHASRGRQPDGREIRVEHQAEWRPLIERSEALGLIERFLQGATIRDVEPISRERVEASLRDLHGLSQAERATLHARALSAAPTLDETTLEALLQDRGAFFSELGAAVGVSGRVLLAAVRARKFPLDPPRSIDGYEYLGSFESRGELVVCDPVYLAAASRGGELSASLSRSCFAGSWHAFVRPGVGEFAGRTAELVTIHSDGFDSVANEPLGTIHVYGGRVGVFDRGCAKIERSYDEGVFGARAAIARSGKGHGRLPVYGGRRNGMLSKIRVHFLGPPSAPVDATMLMKSSARRYSPRERFEVGETIEHAKFGSGTVAVVASDKIDVVFGSDHRTLVHARKP